MSDIETRLVALEYSRNALLEDCQSITVQDAESESLAAQMLISVRDKKREIITFVESHTKPLEKEKQFWFGVRNRLLAPIRPAEENLISQLTQRYKELSDVVGKEEEKLKKNYKGVLPEAIAPYVPVPEKTIETQNGKVTYITHWKAELVDINKVPLFFDGVQIMKEDMVAVNKLVADGAREISGFIIKQETYTRIS